MAIMLLIKRRNTFNGFISQEGCFSLHKNDLPFFSSSFPSSSLAHSFCKSSWYVKSQDSPGFLVFLVSAGIERLRGTTGWA